jgi:hypothetical protein
MIDVQVHFRGHDVEQRQFPSVPQVGDVVDLDGLWRVVCVVFGTAADVYAVPADPALAVELAGWCDVLAPAEPVVEQRALFT